MIMAAARDTNAFMQAFVASEEMNNAARYLELGRRFAGLGNAALKKAWADAWCAYYAEHKADRWSDCQDTDAELMLRRLPRPEHLIPPETRRRIVARIREDRRRPEVSRQLREQFQDFVRQAAARRN